MERKQTVLQQLDSFIEQSESRITTILAKLGWSKENLLQTELQPASKTEDNVDEKPSQADEKFPPSFHPIDSPFSIRLDNIKQADAILEGLYQNSSFELGVSLEDVGSREPPTSIEDLHVNFTREERLLLYEHAVKNTSRPACVPDVKIRFKRDSHTEEKSAAWPEIAAMERDARRRNPKHRVARNPLTYTEELSHLIHIQTEALAQHWQQQLATAQEVDTPATPPKKAKRRRRSRSRSIAVERRHGKKKRTRSRSRSAERAPKHHPASSKHKHHKSHRKHKKKHDR